VKLKIIICNRFRRTTSRNNELKLLHKININRRRKVSERIRIWTSDNAG